MECEMIFKNTTTQKESLDSQMKIFFKSDTLEIIGFQIFSEEIFDWM